MILATPDALPFPLYYTFSRCALEAKCYISGTDIDGARIHFRKVNLLSIDLNIGDMN